MGKFDHVKAEYEMNKVRTANITTGNTNYALKDNWNTAHEGLSYRLEKPAWKYPFVPVAYPYTYKKPDFPDQYIQIELEEDEKYCLIALHKNNSLMSTSVSLETLEERGFVETVNVFVWALTELGKVLMENYEKYKEFILFID